MRSLLIQLLAMPVLLAGPLVAKQELSATTVLLEAEDYAECSPEGHDVARVHDLPWASARTGLIRFPAVDRITWRFEVGEPESYDLWIRYAAAREVSVRWSLDANDWMESRVPGTGAFEGRGAWDWAKLGTFDLEAQAHELHLAGAPMRPDCFLLTVAGGEKPDWPPAPTYEPHSAELLDQLRTTQARISADWMTESASIELPPWIEETRIGLHTRLSVAWTDKPLFTQAETAAAELGAPAIVRHVKSMGGQCFWPSAWGAVAAWVKDATTNGVDPVVAMAERAQQEGLAFIAYYRHQEDRPLAQEHPDWVCRDSAGQIIRRSGEPRLCFHSPFAGATLGRLLELEARGADGIYLDESHQPLEGCWCNWTRAAFQRETGLPLPRAPLIEDPLYRRFLAFTEDSLARELWRWREALRKRNPEFVLMVSTHRQPNLTDPLPTLRLATVGDVVKTEFASGSNTGLFEIDGQTSEASQNARDAMLSLGWAMSRDAAFGRPAHVWIHNLAGGARWKAAAAAVVATGCLANLDHPEQSLPDQESFSAAFALGREIAVPMARSRPVADILLHLPERARIARLQKGPSARAELFGPLAQAWQALLAAHLPARILSDDELEFNIPSDAQLIFLPAPRHLTLRQAEAIKRFRERGGIVVEVDHKALLAAAKTLGLPVKLTAPAGVQANWYRAQDGALVLGLTNSPGWLLDSKAAPPPLVEGATLELMSPAKSITAWPGGITLPLPESAQEREVQLPSFQEALTLRIEQ